MFSGDLERLSLTPLDFKGEDYDHFPRSIEQLENWGDRVYIRSDRDGFVVLVDDEGIIVDAIGGRGAGPGEFRGGILAAAVIGDKVVAMSRGDRDRFSLFLNDVFVNNVPIVPPIYNSLLTCATNCLAFNGEIMVFPTNPRSGHLAFAYAMDGARDSLSVLCCSIKRMPLCLKRTPT